MTKADGGYWAYIVDQMVKAVSFPLKAIPLRDRPLVRTCSTNHMRLYRLCYFSSQISSHRSQELETLICKAVPYQRCMKTAGLE